MALPTRANVLTMDYSGNGSPFCLVAAKAGIELDGLDYSMVGSPWWGLEAPAVGGNIEKVATVTYDADIESVAGITRANIQKVAGVDGQ